MLNSETQLISHDGRTDTFVFVCRRFNFTLLGETSNYNLFTSLPNTGLIFSRLVSILVLVVKNRMENRWKFQRTSKLPAAPMKLSLCLVCILYYIIYVFVLVRLPLGSHQLTAGKAEAKRGNKQTGESERRCGELVTNLNPSHSFKPFRLLQNSRL